MNKIFCIIGGGVILTGVTTIVVLKLYNKHKVQKCEEKLEYVLDSIETLEEIFIKENNKCDDEADQILLDEIFNYYYSLKESILTEENVNYLYDKLNEFYAV